MALRELVHVTAEATEAAGILLIVGGLIVASVRSVAQPTASDQSRFRRYRHDLGRAIVLGLEVLVAADIIRTVAFSPTMDSLAHLAFIILIRTFLAWSLALELEGRWPWQRADRIADVMSSLQRRAS